MALADRSDPATVALGTVDVDALRAAIDDAHRRYRHEHPESAKADTDARVVLPGGNTRSVLHFEPFPFRVVSADGAELIDVDGHTVVDFCGNYTAGLLGHSPPRIRAAIGEVLDSGWAIGATHQREIELASLVVDRFPAIDQVRFTNSGTEANLMAIGTALHHTGRSGVGVFDHGYHGGVLAFGELGTDHNALNVPHRFVVAEFDDSAGLDDLFADDDLGCVVIEAVQGSGGCRPASPEFLNELQRRCREHGVVFILDEVMTSRLAPGGAQERFALDPDLVTLGKYLGGGMTFGAFGGKRAMMANFDARQGGTLTQAGTFNNNVVSMTAAIATLTHELDDDVLLAVNERGDRLRAALGEAFDSEGVPLWVTGLGSMLCVHADHDEWVELFFHAMLTEGHYLARRGFMALSMAITDDHADALVDSARAWAKAQHDDG